MTTKRSRGTWGSPEDVEALYSAYLDPIRLLCRSYVNNDTLAEDAAHEAFKRTLEHRDSVGFRRHPRRFLVSEARRICQEYLRQTDRETVDVGVVLTEGDDPAAVVGESLELRDLLSLLTEPQKAVLAHVFAGYEVKEIAWRVGWPYGTVASRLGRLRDTARRREEELQARQRLRDTLPGVAMVLSRPGDRLRRWACGLAGRAAAPDITAGMSPQLASVAALAMVGLTVGSAASQLPAAAPTAVVTVRTTPAPSTHGVQGAPTTTEVTDGVSTRASSGDTRASVARGSAVALPQSPSETRLVTVAPAPHYDQNHTVVALGHSDTCHCLVLFQSTDGAAHWSSAPGPPSGAQVGLPPDYPNDPRIFIGNLPSIDGPPDYVIDHFGGAASPLLAVSGFLAPAADFDTGNPLLYIATGNGVMALDMASRKVSVAVVTSGRWGNASVAPAPTDQGVLALVPPGSAQLPSLSQPLGERVTVSAALLGCQTEVCNHLADTGSPLAQRLAVSTTYGVDHLLVAWAPGAVPLAVSRDGGHTFVALAPPTGAEAVYSATAGGTRLWIAALVGGVARVYWTSGSGGPWHEVAVPSSSANRAAVVSLVAVGADRLLLLVDGQGYRCTANGGWSWAATCPPA